MDTLRVRAYNVRFGDAILVSVPDRSRAGVETMRHILIDVGNVLSGTGGQDELFEPVIENIIEVLNGAPLDLYVMTHEHLDHVQGLLWARQKHGLNISARHSWLTASAAPGYYERFPEAKRKKLEAMSIFEEAEHFLSAGDESKSQPLSILMLNNNPRKTADCVEHLRTVGVDTQYVFCGMHGGDLTGLHPFDEAHFEIWAPEEDTSVYYGRFQPMTLGLTPAIAGGFRLTDPQPPRGVDAGAFFDLVERRRAGLSDNLLAIDKAANDSSVVFLLEWRGWRLLFTGDAEHRSWQEMDKRGLLKPVHFLKVAHHGSWNGTPSDEILDQILPAVAPDERPRRALVSTCVGTYDGVPSEETLNELRDRCQEVIRVGKADDPLFVDLEFRG